MKKKDIFILAGLGAFLILEFTVGNSWLSSAAVLATAGLCYRSAQKFRKDVADLFGLNPSSQEFDKELKEEVAHMKDGMEEASQLIADLGKEGARSFQVLSQGESLAESIIQADEKIKNFNEQEAKRKWRIEGLAKFSELLRSHDANVEDLSNELISGLVRYIEANQGSIFLLKKEGDEQFLELNGCYAYDKHRIREKRIEIGQGLIGQCFLERETLFLLDIPSDYVNITSGLGEATPTNMVIVPLIVSEKIYGVMEFATFVPLKDYQIQFLEQVAENIASVFASLINAEKTQSLLEDSQKLTSELQASEEEMRQNMEELSATQEEMNRKQSELDGVIGAINQTMGLAELNADGKITFANSIFSEMLNHTEQSILDRTYRDIIGQNDERGEFLRRICEKRLGANHYQTRGATGKEKWLSVSFSPMFDQYGSVKKVLVLSRDITERKLQEIEFEKLSLVADNTDSSVIITDKEGHIEYINQGFCEMTGYSEKEVMGRKPGDFLQGEDTNMETVERIRENLEKGLPIYEEILNYTKSGESYWISMAINPVFDKDGKLDKYISIQANITDTKKSALDFSYKLKAISKSNAIVEFDIEGNIVDANENFLSIVGYSPEEVIGKHHRIFVTNEERDSKAYQEFWERLSKGECINKEFERVRKDGQHVWLRGIYNPIYDLSGKPYKIVKFAIDITKEKQLKRETQKQEAELNSQLAAINHTIASAEFSLEGDLRDANEIFRSITGITAVEIENLHYYDILPKGEKEKPQTELMWQNLREGKFFSGEFKFKDRAGKELWLKGTFNPIEDFEGKFYKVMMYAQFNTMEKEKQKDLLGIVNALKSTAPVIELHADGTFKNGNTLFFHEFGYKRLDLRKKPFEDFLLKDKKTPSTREILNKLSKEQFCEYELAFVDTSGVSKNYRTSFSAIFDLEENLTKVLVIMIGRTAVLKV